MPLKCLQGMKGSGKTSLCTKMCFEAYRNNRPILSNYHLNFPYTPISLKQILEDSSILKNAVLALDEAQTMIDCRLCGTKSNRLISYLALQSRKRNLDIIMTSQQLDNLDRRIRVNLDFLYTCYAYKIIEIKGKKRLVMCDANDMQFHRVDRVLVYESNLSMNEYSRFLFNPHPYFALYDSDEFVDIS